jgi:hypothetical protein
MKKVIQCVPRFRCKNESDFLAFMRGLQSKSNFKAFMASAVPNNAKKLLMNGGADLDTDTIKCALLMTNTTADTEIDAITFVSNYGTLDECDSSGYARVTLGSKTVNSDDTNDRAAFDAADASFTSLGGNATRAIQGALVFKFVTNDAASPPLFFVDFTADIPTTATQVDVPWNVSGLLLLT